MVFLVFTVHLLACIANTLQLSTIDKTISNPQAW